MSGELPSYEEATSRDPWTIIVPYLEPADLSALSQTCKRIGELTTEVLWADPGEHFGNEGEEIFSKSRKTAVS